MTPAARFLTRLVRALGSISPGRVVRAWRASLRTRVVVSIVVLSAIVIGGVGLLVMRQLTDGLVRARVNSALAEAGSDTATAQKSLGASGGSAVDPGTQLAQLAANLVSRGEVRGYDVVILGPVGATPVSQSQGVFTSPGLDPASVPDRLERSLADVEPGVPIQPRWTYTRVRYKSPQAGSQVAGVAIATTVVLPTDGGTYAVYYVFPMRDEMQTLQLLRRVLLTSGLLLLVLLAGVTLLVIRQVITPVRLARRVAERIAAGRLEERMHVQGEDDLARLALSFNQMAEALQQRIRQLIELSRVQRRFVSDVSHELRTPLTTVRMASDVLHDARAGFDPVTARAAELLQNELNRFEALLGDLLEISRIDAGAAALEVHQTNLVDLCTRVVESSAPLAAQRGVHVGVVADTEAVADVDPRRVARIVRNLVTNAIDHAGAPGAVVTVRLAEDDQAVAVAVRDHGIGLEPGQQTMVFNRFWRADPARARTSGGTGLGLAIALEDARLHGGWLEAWGEPGLGACFRLTLPRRPGDTLTSSPLPLGPESDSVGGIA